MTALMNLEWYEKNRRKLGIGLAVGGIVPMVVLMCYIVIIKTPSLLVIGATLLSWGVFFIGKTMLKSGADPEAQQDTE